MSEIIFAQVAVIVASGIGLALLVTIAATIAADGGPDDEPGHEAWEDGHLADLDQLVAERRTYEATDDTVLMPALAQAADHHHAPGRKSLRVLFGHRLPPRDGGAHRVGIAVGSAGQQARWA